MNEQQLEYFMGEWIKYTPHERIAKELDTRAVLPRITRIAGIAFSGKD